MRRFLSERVDYDERLHRVYHEASALDEEALGQWARVLGAYLDDGARVVDVGSGTGRWSAFLADRINASVVGVEPSSAMREEAERVSSRDGVEYVGGSAEALPLNDASVDGALMSRVIHNIASLDLGANEVARVVRPGGVCLIAAVFGDRLHDESPLYRFWPQLRRIDQTRYPPLRDVIVAFRDAGFSDITLEPITMRIADTLDDYRARASLRGLSKFEYLTDQEFDEGLAAIDAAVATDSSAVWDRLEVLVLRRRPAGRSRSHSVTRPHPRGSVVSLRGFYDDPAIQDDMTTVVDAKPVVVSRDDGHHAELWLPAGTNTRRPVGLVPRLPRPWSRGDWILVPGRWSWCSALVVQVPGEWRTTWVTWSPAGDFMGWMVDLDRPLRRDDAGFVVDGLQLDLVVDADRQWRWKDQQELERAVELGFVRPADAARARSEGDRTIADIEAARWPFTDEWRDWRPDPQWPQPDLADDWWRIGDVVERTDRMEGSVAAGGERLEGGNVSGATRVGRTVRRRRAPNSAYVHRLLRYLEWKGFDGAPRLVGASAYEETLDYIPGEVHLGPGAEWMAEPAPLASLLGLVRRLHDLTAGSDLAVSGEVVCHGDVAPRNVVWQGQRAIALLDWDLARPGPRGADLALIARRFLALGTSGHEPGLQGRRIRNMLDLYGLEERDGFVFHIIQHQAEMIGAVASIAGGGDASYRKMMAAWTTDNPARPLAWLIDHVEELQRSVLSSTPRDQDWPGR